MIQVFEPKPKTQGIRCSRRFWEKLAAERPCYQIFIFRVILGLYWGHDRPIMANQMEKNMEHEMETSVYLMKEHSIICYLRLWQW